MALMEAQHRVQQLENAIHRVNSVKKHLFTNATDIQNEIGTNFSRHIESLQGREKTLRGQVTRILKMKEESLDRQQLRLSQALAVLKTGLALVHDEAAQEQQLVDTLERLKQIDLSPEETPYISFRADHFQLRDNIQNYGRVDANGLPLMTAFDDPGNPSASLPRQVEEYEDAEHHIFYKPVAQGRKGMETGASSINVSIPKLSNRVEDWLQKKRPTFVPELQRPAPRPSQLWAGYLQQGTSSNTSTPGSSCSLTNWLSFIKQNADLEEEHDFEIVDNSYRGVSGQVNRPSTLETDFFAHIDKDLRKWRKPQTEVQGHSETCWASHLSQDTQIWLSEAYKQLTSLETVPRDFFSHISRDPASWLRSRAHGKVKQTSLSASWCSTEDSTDTWLLKQKTSPLAQPSGTYPQAPPTMTNPQAPPTMTNPLAPVTMTNPLAPVTMTNPVAPVTMTNPLAPVTMTNPLAPVTMTNPLAPVTMTNPLAPPTMTSPVTLPTMTSPVSPPTMLNDHSSLSNPIKFDHIKPLNDPSWLQDDSKKRNTQVSSPPFCVSDWLLLDGLKCEEESDDWTVCSSHSSGTTEQFSRHVAADFYNKWLL